MFLKTVTSNIKNPKDQARKIDRGKFKCAKLLLKKLITRKSQKIKIIIKNSGELQSLWVCLLKGGDNKKYH